jgi:hypothetical protein
MYKYNSFVPFEFLLHKILKFIYFRILGFLIIKYKHIKQLMNIILNKINRKRTMETHMFFLFITIYSFSLLIS